MPDRYISKTEVAALFGSSAKAAEEQLVKAGLRPIHLGPGRKRGKRWLESAVMEAIRRINEKAQPRKLQPRPKCPKTEYVGVDQMSTAEVAALVARTRTPMQLATNPAIQ